ncbi:MAG: carboxypeptidase-like regulatory domain-containing protein [Candidatus Thorarchaeota archaeon]
MPHLLLQNVFARDGVAMVRDAASRIQARQLRNYELDSIKCILIGFLVAFVIFPIMSGDVSCTYADSASIDPGHTALIAADDTRLTVQLTAQSDYIAMGNVSSYRGFAYSDDNADYLRFVDPINDVTLNQSVESGTLQEKTITGADMDDDGSTEFLILNDNGTAFNLLLVDFNDGYTTSYNVSINDPTGIATGTFNDDSNLDVAIFVRYGVIMLDIQTDQLLGNYSLEVGDSISGYAIGRFLEPSQDSIALGVWPGSKIANMSMIAGNGSLIDSIIFHDQINGLARFQFGSGLDDVAVMIFDGNLTTITPSTMSTIYTTNGLPSRSVVTRGFLNHDTQEDLIVAPTVPNRSVYIDGTNGSIIRYTVEIQGAPQGPIVGDPPSPILDYGYIDADNLTDFAILTAVDGNVGFLRGVDGSIGYEDPTISSKPGQIRIYDINNNGRDDIAVIEGQFVYILLSDVQAPIIIPEPLSPPHPTLRDPYVEIEVGIEDDTAIILAEIYMRYEFGNWSQPDELQNAGTQYFAFLVGLPEGFYEYYLLFQDTYLNIGTLGNETHPVNFTVAGHIAWSETKNQATALEHHLMDIGNTSDGSEVIYILDSDIDEVRLERYSPRGENQSLAIVANGTFSDFWLYTGMMDGDNILDPVVILYNASIGKINVSIYHGSSGTPWFSSQYPHLDFRSPQSAQTYDCDNDDIDEVFLVAENSTTHDGFLLRMRMDGSWTETKLSGGHAEYYGLSLASTINDQSVEACVSISTGPVDIINATSMSRISTHNVTSADHLMTIPAGMYSYHNASEPRVKFMVYLFLVDPIGFSCGFHMFDANTPRINETTLITNPNHLYFYLDLIDVENDGTDEAYGIDYLTGDLTLFRLDAPVVIEWDAPISTADFLSSVVVDFDGDGEDEVGVFTKQDEKLTIVSLDGIVERTMVVGQGYGSMRLSNIDLGYGEEIVVYPLVQNGVTKIGVIRDIVLIRRLNASLSYNPDDLQQGDSLPLFVDVTNIYSEVISDAEVYLTIHFQSGSSIINQTKALIYGTSNYSTAVAANWPMGIVNFSLRVDHDLYDQWEAYYPNALTVRSELDVIVYTREVVLQNNTFSADITVTDSLGSRVPDASVTVLLDGDSYLTTYLDPQYRLIIPNVNLIPGQYSVNATASHPFAAAESSAATVFRIETGELQINQDIPTMIEQDEALRGWLNITDMFGNPLENAYVMMVSGSYELTLSELAPGCYYLNSSATFRTGNHTFEIFVEQDYLQGTDFGEIQIATWGDLILEVPDIPPVEGGEDFVVVVFISDVHGTAPSDTWVILEIDGRNVTATQLSIGRFAATLNATYKVGTWNFTVYYGSGFSYAGKGIYDLRVLSDAMFMVDPPDGWSVGQGNTTTIEIHVEDWLGTDIVDATVSLRIRGTSYALEHISEGLYQTEISTMGWPYGVHPYTVTVEHEFLHQGQWSSNLTVIADPIIEIKPSSLEPVQFSTLVIMIDVSDQYEIPVIDLMVMVDFAEMSGVAEETEIPGTYSIAFDIGNTPYGYYNISVTISGSLSGPGSSWKEIFVEVFIPGMDSLSIEQVSMAAGFALLLSLIGMILFVKVSSVVTTSPRKIEEVTRSINQLDKIYAVIIASSGLLFLHSWLISSEGNFGLAVIESIILLGASVLLYGLWLYRDAYSSILLQGQLSKRRIALGVWHLLLVPFIVFLIFTYGASVQMFDRYIYFVPQIVVGEIMIAPLLATVLVTYMSSIVVVVVSFYREIRKGLRRIEDMKVAGTPKHIVDEEQALLVGRTGSSIRIKFLMFLLILGATTIMQLDFLKNYSMAAIILLPVVFLVLIPFASSRIVRSIPGMTKKTDLDVNEEGEEITHDAHEHVDDTGS